MLPVDSIEAQALQRYESATAEHQMTVLHDDGLYRHLRFQKPGTSFYYHDLITWPGHLAIAGDCGDYVFARITDMFDFFHGEGVRINPFYWGEKLKAPQGRDSVLVFDDDKFRAAVNEWYSDQAEELDQGEAHALREALDEQVLADWTWPFTRDQAVSLMSDFEHNGHRIHEAYEYDMREFDGSYLWCCWAIVRGIERYRKSTP